MIVVSDTSPLNYLVLIELQDLLPKLFERILIPKAVLQELQSSAAPDAIKRFLASNPQWLETRSSPDTDIALPQLNPGEREAIGLALATSADLVLLDEKKGRLAARVRGLAVSGTLGVLDLASRREFVTMADAISRLQATSFRLSPRLVRQITGNKTSQG